jgi:hypothetical protein
MEGVPGWLRHPLEPRSEIDKVPGEILNRLPEWRRSWDEIWYVRLGGNDYVWRSPTRKDAIEYDLTSQTTAASAIDQLLKTCVLWPEELSGEMSANDFLTLHDLVWQTSGYRDLEFFNDKLAQYEQIVRSGDHVNILLLIKAFNGLLPDVINTWQPEKIIYHVAIARALLDVEPLQVKRKRRRQPSDQSPPSAPTPEPPAQGPRKPYNWEDDLKEWDAFERS